MQPFLGRRVNVVDARCVYNYTHGGWFRRAVVIRYGVVSDDDKNIHMRIRNTVCVIVCLCDTRRAVTGVRTLHLLPRKRCRDKRWRTLLLSAVRLHHFAQRQCISLSASNVVASMRAP